MTPTNQQIREKLAQDYRAAVAARCPKLTPPVTYCNSTTTGTYTGNNMSSARADADQHFQFLSAPMAAQIRRSV